MYRIRRPAFAVGIPLAATSALLVAWSVGAAPPIERPHLTHIETSADTTPQPVGLDVFADPLAFPAAVRLADGQDQRVASPPASLSGEIDARPDNETTQAWLSIAKESWGSNGGGNSPQAGSFAVSAAFASTPTSIETSRLGTAALNQQSDESDGSSNPNTWLIWWPPFGNAPAAPAIESYAVGHLAQGTNRIGEPVTGVVAWPVWDNTPAAPALEGFADAGVSVLSEGQ